MLDDAGALDPTWERLVQAWPRAIAGAPTASTWDGAARRLRVTFRQDGTDATPTEIVAPAALYPDGIDVATSLGDAGGVDWEWDEGQGVVFVSLRHRPDRPPPCPPRLASRAEIP